MFKIVQPNLCKPDAAESDTNYRNSMREVNPTRGCSPRAGNCGRPEVQKK